MPEQLWRREGGRSRTRSPQFGCLPEPAGRVRLQVKTAFSGSPDSSRRPLLNSPDLQEMGANTGWQTKLFKGQSAGKHTRWEALLHT